MRIAVVTPYFRTPEEWLERSIDSVRDQTVACTHILVADGVPMDLSRHEHVQHIQLGHNHVDYGGTPRAIGSVSAMTQGFDAIAYLDADNWYLPQHLEELVTLHRQSKAALCTSARTLHRLDGTALGPCNQVDGQNFVDTNCLFLTRKAFRLIPVWWTMPAEFHAVGDVFFWFQAVEHGITRAHKHTPTVAFRTAYQWHYREFGEVPPEGARNTEDIAVARRRFAAFATRYRAAKQTRRRYSSG